MNINARNTGISAYQNMANANVKKAETPTADQAIENSKNLETEVKEKEANVDKLELSEEATNKMKELAKETVEKNEEMQAQNMKNLITSMMTNGATKSDVKNLISAQNAATKAEMTDDPAFNVSEDGALGVSAVADDIMNLALAFAGDDPEKLELMKSAVIKGFEAAGLEIDEDGNASGLPGVSIDTFDEIMKRFDYAAENGNSLDGYTYTAYDGSGKTATLTGDSNYSTRDSWSTAE